MKDYKYESLKEYIKQKEIRINESLESAKARHDVDCCITLQCELDLLKDILEMTKHIDIIPFILNK